MNLVLIGLRGSGKTTVGRLVAERLGWRLLDTDTLVQERSRKTIRELFVQGGESLFRELEALVVRDCAAQDRTVVACGGGVVLDPRNVAALRGNGFVVHLTADPVELYARISGDASSAQTRPALLPQARSGLDELKELALVRAAAYAQARHAEVPVGGRTPEEIADTVVALLEARGVPAR